jgi:hypothetical protein
MTPEYRARREAKHAAQFASKPPFSGGFVGTIDRTNKLPVLTFVGLKTHPQANYGRKNRSGHAPEHVQANADNALFDAARAAEVNNENLVVSQLPEGTIQ